MAAQYLLDTNICSYIIKGNMPQVRHRLLRVAMSRVSVSSVTEGELLYGVARKQGATSLQRTVEEFLLRVNVLPWDSDAAHHYGSLRAELERVGLPMGNLDLMIAAHALATGSVLVTRDRSFAHIKKLKTEDWTV